MERKVWGIGGWLVLLLVMVAGCLPNEVPVTVTRVTALPTTTATIIPTATMTAVPPAAPEPSATPSPTPILTSTPTPIPTMRPFATVTPPPGFDTKTVFIAMGLSGGDGNRYHNYSSAPKLVIYTDGQVIWQEGDYVTGFHLLESAVSSDEMCSLLSQLKDSGFFEELTELYAFDETTQYSDGAASYSIQVNGPRLGYHIFYGPYVPYLVEEVATGFDLLQNFHPSPVQSYNPTRLMLLVEPVSEERAGDRVVEPWPADMPAISEIRPDPASLAVMVEGENVARIMDVFGNRPDSKWFREGDNIYLMIARPLLPHETPQEFWANPGSPSPIQLPFSCEDPTLLAATPTPTVTPPKPTATLDPAASVLSGRIAFTAHWEENKEIYVMNADGSGLTRLTNHWANDFLPIWSPDGQKIAFASDRDGNDEVYVMDADGSSVTRLTYAAGWDYPADWIMDGEQIAYITNPPNRDIFDVSWQIHLVRPDGSDDVSLTNDQASYWLPDWSADGQQVVYAKAGSRRNAALFYADANVANSQSLGLIGSWPVWSPNSEQIAYINGGNLFVTAVGDSQPRQLASGIYEWGRIDWSPDGRYILYSGGGIKAINVQDGQVIQVSSAFHYVDELTWWP